MRWTKGQSGNPHGRPRKGQSLTEALESAVTPSKRRQLAKVVLEKALAGDPWAIGFLFDRIEGKVPLRVDVSERVRELAREAGLNEEDVEAAVREADSVVREHTP